MIATHPTIASNDAPPPGRFLRIADVVASTGFSRATLYRWIEAGTFPAPVKIGAASRWIESEVEAWKLTQAHRRDAA